MDEIEILLNQMRLLEPQVHVYGPAGEESIRQLEAVFGHPMPPTYRQFLARLGGMLISNQTYSGIIDENIDDGRGSAWTDTTTAREWCQLPDHYLVVQPDEDGYTCPDFSRTTPDGENPVIYHMPFRQTPFHRAAANFAAWLTEDLEAMVEAWSDDAEEDVSPESGQT